MPFVPSGTCTNPPQSPFSKGGGPSIGSDGGGEAQSDKHTEEVIPCVKRFKEIKKGDEVVVRHTEALAISFFNSAPYLSF